MGYSLLVVRPSSYIIYWYVSIRSSCAICFTWIALYYKIMLIYLIILIFATVCKRFFHWSKSCHAVQSKSTLQNKRGRMLSVHYSELNFNIGRCVLRRHCFYKQPWTFHLQLFWTTYARNNRSWKPDFKQHFTDHSLTVYSECFI